MTSADEIKSKLDIVEIIGEYLNLKAVGSNFRASCPFHNEKTPSFMVSSDKQIWHCFGCGKGGDLITFIMEIEGLEFLEALKLLAPRAGVVLKNKSFDSSSASNKEKLLKIMDLSSRYYNFILSKKDFKSDKLSQIKEYLKERGLNEGVIARWNIGYSLDNYNDLIKFLKSKGFSDTEILAAGMSFKSKQGKFFNRFRDRIMFPINDVNGRPVAFTARINPFTSDDKGLGKYINSPQGEIYDKSKILFALDRAKKSARENDYLILVEGQMDAISAHEAGFSNVCAISGTALTVAQLNLIKRYTKNIIIAFDQDGAGELAVDRGVSEALRMGFNIKIASLEKGKDPDDIIREDKGIFAQALREAQSILDYYLTKELKGLDLSNISLKNKAVNKLLTVINKLSSKVEQDFWLKELSQRARVDEIFLREELDKMPDNIGENREVGGSSLSFKKDEQLNLDTWGDKLAENLLSLLLKFDKYCEYVFSNLEEHFLTPKYQSFYKTFIIYYNKNKHINYQDLYNYFIKEKNELFLDYLKKISLISDFLYPDPVVLEESAKEEILKIITEIKKNYYRDLIKEENEVLRLVELEGDDKKVFESLKKLKKLNEDLNKII